MKNIILTIISILAFLILIGDSEITIAIITLKAISLLWLWLVAKSNNYFYKGE